MVTKSVRGEKEAVEGSEGRVGIDMAGAEALQILQPVVARLKSCPDASGLPLAAGSAIQNLRFRFQLTLYGWQSDFARALCHCGAHNPQDFPHNLKTSGHK